jgi:hypothetical protein
MISGGSEMHCMTCCAACPVTQAAIVGWDSESLVDLDDLETDWRNGDPPDYSGLVLADDLCEE